MLNIVAPIEFLSKRRYSPFVGKGPRTSDNKKLFRDHVKVTSTLLGESGLNQSASSNQHPEGGASSGPARATRHGFERVREDHASEIAQDYVELIADLIEENGEARAVEIAQRLGVSHVTVNKTIGRLKKEGLVTSEPYRAVFLTAKGQALADESKRKHEIVLAFLIRLGVPPSDAEIDAEGIEHHLSPSTLSAMLRFLGETDANH